MPTPTIKELREAIAAAINNIDGLRASHLILEQVSPPQATVFRKPWTYDEVQHGPSEDAPRTYLFGVHVYVSRTADRAGQELLDDYAEPFADKSIKQTIESNDDLLDLCDYVLVTEVGEVLVTTIDQVEYLMEDFTVQVAI